MARTTPPTTTASLRRWLAGWLAVLLCAQALAAAGALLRPLHRHAPLAQRPLSMQAPMQVQVPVQRLLLWRHASAAPPAAALHDAHARAHLEGQAHEHPAGDLSVLPAAGGDAAPDAASLAAFFAAPPPRAPVLASAALRHVWSGPARWAATARTIAPPHRPPRA